MRIRAKERYFSLPNYEVMDSVQSLKQLEAMAKSAHIKERINWAEAALGIPQAWRDSMGEGIKVAILDTGVDTDHDDLKDAILVYRDFTGDGIEDQNGHGTHCAGIVGARLNSIGFVGVAPKCDLIIGKVLGNDGSGSYEMIASGIEWAVEQKANIISMSLGGPVTTPELHRSIHFALSEGVAIVCAAGNDGSLGRNTIGYPGRYGSVITIAAHDQQGNRAGFSSYGGEVDFMAPGTEIWSTYKNNTYASLSGTSMATPMVAGLSALILSKHVGPEGKQGSTPINTNEDLHDHLLFMSSHPGHHDSTSGYGPLLPWMYFG